MAEYTVTKITNVPAVPETGYKRLVSELISNAIGNESSAFGEVKQMLRDELEKATDLDSSQRAGVFAGFLKDTYADVNKDAMRTAMDLLKTNEQFKLETIKLEADVNATLLKNNIGLIDKEIRSKELMLKQKELKLADDKLIGQKLANYELRARLEKQWGVKPTVSVNMADGDKMFRPEGLGSAMRWYRVNANGEYLKADGNVTANQSEAEQPSSTNVSVSEALANTVAKGAIDMQIAGYGKVNDKDILKTMTEMSGMYTNAKKPIPGWLDDVETKLITAISDTVSIGDGATDATNGSTTKTVT